MGRQGVPGPNHLTTWGARPRPPVLVPLLREDTAPGSHPRAKWHCLANRSANALHFQLQVVHVQLATWRRRDGHDIVQASGEKPAGKSPLHSERREHQRGKHGETVGGRPSALWLRLGPPRRKRRHHRRAPSRALNHRRKPAHPHPPPSAVIAAPPGHICPTRLAQDTAVRCTGTNGQRLRSARHPA
ncbi:hypothetical protein I4F81_012122 [Pyropia yezoensis]|uniref:Uncharacterized protein n=1 Tax=Pyropia yezoensis TaxID=2788 RepID=A0ACC3CIV1_PYRYE|nr:hypothetical protein I4F81_012122 [Neopyropia yezoensis]